MRLRTGKDLYNPDLLLVFDEVEGVQVGVIRCLIEGYKVRSLMGGSTYCPTYDLALEWLKNGGMFKSPKTVKQIINQTDLF